MLELKYFLLMELIIYRSWAAIFHSVIPISEVNQNKKWFEECNLSIERNNVCSYYMSWFNRTSPTYRMANLIFENHRWAKRCSLLFADFREILFQRKKNYRSVLISFHVKFHWKFSTFILAFWTKFLQCYFMELLIHTIFIYTRITFICIRYILHPNIKWTCSFKLCLHKLSSFFIILNIYITW